MLSQNSSLGPLSNLKISNLNRFVARLFGTLTMKVYLSVLMMATFAGMTIKESFWSELSFMKEPKSMELASAKISVFWVLLLIMAQRSWIQKLWRFTDTSNNNCQ